MKTLNFFNLIKTISMNLEITYTPTVENIKKILEYLNKLNWGTWILPQMSVSYTANQYDCDGIQATTLSLDTPIKTKAGKVRHFKIGGKRNYLNKYQNITRL